MFQVGNVAAKMKNAPFQCSYVPLKFQLAYIPLIENTANPMIHYASGDGKCVTLMSNAYGIVKNKTKQNQFSHGLLSNTMNQSLLG